MPLMQIPLPVPDTGRLDRSINPVKAATFLVAAAILLAATIVVLPARASLLGDVQSDLDTHNVSAATFDKLQSVLTRDPSNALAHVLLGKTYDAVGMRDMAREQFAEAHRLDPSRSKEVLRQFKEKYHSDSPATGFMDWVEIRQTFPEDEDIREMETVIALLFGTVSTAESSYISEQKHGHTLMSVATMLSNRRSVQRRFAEAQKLAQTDINLHPKDTGAQMAKAVALNGLGQYHAAIACAQPIFLRYPYQAGVASTLAMAYCRAGHFQEALTPMLYEIARADSGSEQQEAIALAELVMPHLSSKDIADGLARVSTQIDQTNHHASFHHNLSQVFERLGDPKRAEQELRIAVDASMSNSQWMMQLGNLNESERKYKEALQSYMAAQTMSPESEAIALRLHRFETRLVNQGNDLAWRLRDAIRGH